MNVIALGPVWTPLNPSGKEAADVETFGAKTPMRRAAQPEKIAPAYVFLASPHLMSKLNNAVDTDDLQQHLADLKAPADEEAHRTLEGYGDFVLKLRRSSHLLRA